MLELRNSGNDIVAPYAEEFPGSTFYPGKKPWEQKVDIALPCATQNELDADDARKLIENKTSCVAEVSNMGCTAEAVDLFIEHKQLFRTGQGCQRRRCRHFRPGNDSERHAYFVDSCRSR